uniref:Uncharacterized protein n=1 Tax=Craspedostauros australis TaxID=1486917 RepID=A0A7R9WWK5_9STRA|mmetsp:Transcript_21830/g.60783  ORF Transcript_21830/g.60783 Transcript_21830/m.60783 type:complete len:204 (+) Transcript_21830:331-942(+)
MSALPTMSPAAEGNRFVDEQDAPLELKHVSWIRQFKFMQRKSMLLMSRRPILMAMMLFSSIVSVVFGWLLGRPSKNAIYGPVDQCGIITSLERDSDGFEDDDQQITRNDRFRSGFVVALMALGPMLNAICAFLLVHDEFANQLIGVLRGLGLRDSAFWSSWYAAIMMVNVINAALGTITVKSLVRSPADCLRVLRADSCNGTQ